MATTIKLIDDFISSPIILSYNLNFTEEDKNKYPWLKNQARFYSLETELDPGGFAIPVIGYPCTSEGIKLLNSPKIIIKIPNLGEESVFTQNEQDQRTDYIRKQSIQEWVHIRKRLLNCKHGNPIFDLGTIWLKHANRDLYITVQEFLEDAIPLKEWLVQQRLKPQSSYDEKHKEIDNWRGISESKELFKVAIFVAEGLAEIHNRRVIHADIWPANIFIRNTTEPYAIFIDFGESFVVTPGGNSGIQKNHPYRAPEREGGEYVLTEQIDVYSFGKLLLYLLIGTDKLIPRDVHGHERRAFIRNAILDRNPTLAKQHPQIVDIIAQCTSLDPVARPRMKEIVEDLNTLNKKNHETLIDCSNFSHRLDKIKSGIESNVGSQSSVFMRFVDKQISEMERLIDNYSTEMIELDGTRDQLLRALLLLFNELKTDDSWTSITTPSVWQDSALGLDGRYATATVEAIRRGANVHRVFIVSVEELGIDWSKKLSSKLEKTGIESLTKLGKIFDSAIHEYETNHIVISSHIEHNRDFITAHRNRFISVIQSIRNMIQIWGITRISPVFEEITKTQGLYIGIIPVPTLSLIRRIRTENPVSLMHFNYETINHNKWLLVMTDIRGRNENEPRTVSTPQLRRIRIYRSVMGVPHDRIIGIQRLIKEKSVSIGNVIQQFTECLPP